MSSQRYESQEIFRDKSILIFLRVYTTIVTAYTACPEASEREFNFPFLREDINYNWFKKKVAETIREMGISSKNNNNSSSR